jgi:hypothetical protein
MKFSFVTVNGKYFNCRILENLRAMLVNIEMFEVRIPAGVGEFSVLQEIHTGSGAHVDTYILAESR